MRKIVIREFEISVSTLAGIAIFIMIAGAVWAFQAATPSLNALSCGAGPPLKVSPSGQPQSTVTSPTNAELDKATRDLFRQNQAFKKPPKSGSETKIQQAAKTRKNLMLDEMRKNPDGAITQVLSDSERTESLRLTQNCAEVPATVEGSLEVIHADFTNKTDVDTYILQTADKKRINLHPAKKSRTKLTSGKQLKIKGYRLDNDLLFDASDQNAFNVVSKPVHPWDGHIAEAAPTATTGSQQTIVLMVYFHNTAQPALTQASANNTIFTQMNSYYQESSYNQMGVAGTSVNWLKIPMNQTCEISSGLDAVQNSAVAAADPSVNFASYSRIIIVANYGGINCGWSGVGTIGKTFVNTADGRINASVSWVDSSSMGVATHEFGHNLGLDHAQFYNCGSATFSSSGCTLDEYGDQYSPMGTGSTAHMNAPEKEFLGWLGTTHTQTITANGNYTIEPIETAPTGIKSIKIQRSNSGGIGYQYSYYEYRTATGSDSSLNANVLSGALIHNFTDSYTWLLDATPPGDKNTPALPVGSSYTDPATATKVTLTAKTASALTFNVVIGKTDFSTPTASITSPAYNATVSGSINAAVSASAPSGIQKVDFYLDNASNPSFTDTSAPYSYAVDTTALSDGYHYIYAVATDKSGEAYSVPGNQSGKASTRIITSNNTPVVSDTLNAAQTLNSGDTRQSSDSQYKTVMQTDGNLVMYNATNQPIWNSATTGNPGSKLVMQTDGNLVIYNSANQPIWNSATTGNPGSKLVMQTDGNLVIYNSANKAVWSRFTGKIPLFPAILNSGQILNPGGTLQSTDTRYRLIMQTDGNLVIYDASNKPVWYTATQTGGSKLVMQTDGNLVIYNSANQPIWNSATNGDTGSKLVMQTDGNLVIYNPSNKPVWSRFTGKL